MPGGYFDPRLQAQVFKLMPGRFHVATADEVIATLLGSCVAACIYDPLRSVGGMNHFLLPETSPGEDATLPVSSGARYGAFAMESLINALLARGAARNRLRVKLFGGARVLARLSDVGQRNIEFVRRFVALEQLQVVGEDLGGDQPRKLLMYPATGRVLVRRLPPVEASAVAVAETRFLRSMDAPVTGSAELF
jgi:chemotaxis protein CheD